MVLTAVEGSHILKSRFTIIKRNIKAINFSYCPGEKYLKKPTWIFAILGSKTFHFWGLNLWIHKFWGLKSFNFGAKFSKLLQRKSHFYSVFHGMFLLLSEAFQVPFKWLFLTSIFHNKSISIQIKNSVETLFYFAL